MKKIRDLIFLVILVSIFVLPHASFAQAVEPKPNCTQQMEEFEKYPGIASDEVKLNMQVCKAYCSKIANYADAREFCGLEDCKYMAADGQPSPWCCEVATYWQGKLGANTNPLAPIMDMCKKQKLYKVDFVTCANKMRNRVSPDSNCCSVMKDIRKFDPIMAYDLKGFCKKNNLPTN